MALPILPIALLGGGALLFLSSRKGGSDAAPAPGGAGSPSGGSQIPGLPDLSQVSVQTPGIAPSGGGSSSQPQLDTSMKTAIANALKGLGIDPTTGQVMGQATPAAIESATALAALLEAQGFKDAANALRAYAAQAAKAVPVKTPDALTQLPPELSQELSRALSLEGDPKRIRALVARVRASQWAQNPQILATLAALEARATQLEKEQDAVRTAKEVETILKTPDDFTLPKTTPIVVPSTAAPVTLPTPAAPSASTYTVQTGDNPSALAKRFTGDANRWRELQAANTRYDFTKQFWTGMVLTLPASWRGGSAPPLPVVTSAPSPVSVPALTPVPASAGPKTYTVKSGDYPAAVAKTFTGDANRWRELQKVNTRYDFTKQFWAGMVLNLPAGW